VVTVPSSGREPGNGRSMGVTKLLSVRGLLN